MDIYYHKYTGDVFNICMMFYKYQNTTISTSLRANLEPGLCPNRPHSNVIYGNSENLFPLKIQSPVIESDFARIFNTFISS